MKLTMPWHPAGSASRINHHPTHQQQSIPKPRSRLALEHVGVAKGAARSLRAFGALDFPELGQGHPRLAKVLLLPVLVLTGARREWQPCQGPPGTAQFILLLRCWCWYQDGGQHNRGGLPVGCNWRTPAAEPQKPSTSTAAPTWMTRMVCGVGCTSTPD